ncbi:MAG TPA: nucleoside monophosphate kinase [Candidatus Saccharimonadia bacterium]|nr:nucleoside monophosphate kinase [Candidatus Saccharimonadia bacterium]
MAEIVVLWGPTGAGKTVQGERLATAKGWAHFSTGRLLRRDPVTAAQLRSGELAPTAEVQRVLTEAVAAVPRHQGIVLDGFPRTADQAAWLEQQLPQWGRHLRRVILLSIDEATSRERLRLRSRSDDSSAAQREKWREYQKLMQPLVAFYQPRGLLAIVDGGGTIDQVTESIEATLA